jgi:hypothetical protein
MASDLKIRTYSEAQRILRNNLTVLQREHHPDFTTVVIDRLVRYVFGSTDEDCFWSLVRWFNTLTPHDSTWRTFYFEQGGEDVGTRTRDVDASLGQIKKGIDYFCGAGPLLNDALNLLDERYRTKLDTRGPAGSVSLPLGCNLLVDLRDVIKANSDEIIGMVKRGRPEKRDYLLDFLLAVSRHVFPSVPPTGDSGNTFCLFAQAVFSACFFYEGRTRSVSAVGLPSRVEKCVESGRVLFEYVAATDSFVATEEMKVENGR